MDYALAQKSLKDASVIVGCSSRLQGFTERRAAFLASFFPGLAPLDMARLGSDIIAGITLAALGTPEVMGYAKIIGTPVITGLYTLFLPVLLFAMFGSSLHLVVNADSATAAMVGAALVSHACTATHPDTSN